VRLLAEPTFPVVEVSQCSQLKCRKTSLSGTGTNRKR